MTGTDDSTSPQTWLECMLALTGLDVLGELRRLPCRGRQNRYYFSDLVLTAPEAVRAERRTLEPRFQSGYGMRSGGTRAVRLTATLP
jgi:hypothetical protein